jgi:Zn-dependent protease
MLSHANFVLMAAVVIGLPVSLFVFALVFTLVQTLRMPIGAVVRRRLDGPAELAADQQAAVAALEGLGFVAISHGECTQLGRARHDVVFRHQHVAAYARLSFQPLGLSGYPVFFYSLDTEGRLLETTNRLGFLNRFELPGVLSDDAYAGTLPAHWQFHGERVQGSLLARVDDEAMLVRIEQYLADATDQLLASGQLIQQGELCYPTLRVALRITWARAQARKRLKVPYVAAELAEVHRADYYAHCSEELAATQKLVANRRQDVRNGLLALSFAVSLVGFGLWVGWGQALILMLVLFLHEAGHAAAMRWFGFGPISMVFIPFFGAVVVAPFKPAQAWKQAVILLAGPLPGLVVGLVLLRYQDLHPVAGGWGHWHELAVTLAFLNGINLAPIAPLDGGRLVELALFQRWPVLRFLFTLSGVALFCAFAWKVQEPFTFAMAAFLALLLPTQWRTLRLQRAARPELDEREQLRHLFGFAASRFGRKLGFAKLNTHIRVALAHRSQFPTRRWEAALILAVLLASWIGGGVVYGQQRGLDKYRGDSRTEAQRQFDDAYEHYERYGSAYLSQLEQRAEGLAADDPRHIDVAAYRARHSDTLLAMDALIKAGKPGHFQQIDDMVGDELELADEQTFKFPPQERADKLRAVIAQLQSITKLGVAQTIDTRIAIAAAVDKAGHSDEAATELATLRHYVDTQEACHCHVGNVYHALAWFHLHHGRIDAADNALHHAIPKASDLSAQAQLDADRVWVLLAQGEHGEALTRMRELTYRPLRQYEGAGKTGRKAPPEPYAPMTLAYVLQVNGLDADAKQLIASVSNYHCLGYGPEGWADVTGWEADRADKLEATAKALCPAWRDD